MKNVTENYITVREAVAKKLLTLSYIQKSLNAFSGAESLYV